MDWIKKRYDQFLLALVAVALLAFSVIVYLKTSSFGERFTEAMATVPVNKTIPPLKLGVVEEAKQALEKPPLWVLETDYEHGNRGSLFVSQHYIVDASGVPKKPIGEAVRTDTYTLKKIPNRWFMDHNLSWLETTAGLQDPDKDGFANEDEWRFGTDPTDKNSHPPYYTKLFFKSVIRVQFRLVFASLNGDPKKPETLEFQINTVDLRQASEFLKLGQTVPNTKYKLEKFEAKEVMNRQIQEMQDVSELTLVNTETNDPVVLVIGRVTNSPDVSIIFEYQWPQPHQDIRVKKLQDFALRPETDKDHFYKLIDIKETEAVIRLPDGQTYTVVRDPRKAGR